MVTVIVAEVSPNLLSLTRHAGLILAGIPVEESESESRSKKIRMDPRTPCSPYYHICVNWKVNYLKTRLHTKESRR